MRYGRVMGAVAAVAIIASGAVAMAPVGMFSGHYYRLGPVKVKKRLVWPRVNDLADIAPIDAEHAFVRLDLKLDRADCHFAGIARVERDELVYRDLTQGGDATRACTVVFTREGGALQWSDNGHCRERCSSGALTGSLPLSHRGAAPGMASLSKSGDYRAAIDEWRSAGPQ
jgi:hypothetical protein